MVGKDTNYSWLSEFFEASSILQYLVTEHKRCFTISPMAACCCCLRCDGQRRLDGRWCLLVFLRRAGSHAATFLFWIVVETLPASGHCLGVLPPPANFCCFARPTPSQPLGWRDAAAWWHSTNHHHAHFYVLGFTFAEHGATCTHIHFPAAKISNMTQLNAKSMLHTFSSKPKLF